MKESAKDCSPTSHKGLFIPHTTKLAIGDKISEIRNYRRQSRGTSAPHCNGQKTSRYSRNPVVPTYKVWYYRSPLVPLHTCGTTASTGDEKSPPRCLFGKKPSAGSSELPKAGSTAHTEPVVPPSCSTAYTDPVLPYTESVRSHRAGTSEVR